MSSTTQSTQQTWLPSATWAPPAALSDMLDELDDDELDTCIVALEGLAARQEALLRQFYQAIDAHVVLGSHMEALRCVGGSHHVAER